MGASSLIALSMGQVGKRVGVFAQPTWFLIYRFDFYFGSRSQFIGHSLVFLSVLTHMLTMKTQTIDPFNSALLWPVSGDEIEGEKQNETTQLHLGHE